MTTFSYEFVESAPDKLSERVIYISIRFRTVIHLCACGCKAEIVTPLGRREWKLVFDGESISLDPSIGSRALPCRSHYWIRRSKLKWAGWPDATKEIEILGVEKNVTKERKS